jgi:predicted DNA-binding transcriptional regulator AlpA
MRDYETGDSEMQETTIPKLIDSRQFEIMCGICRRTHTKWIASGKTPKVIRLPGSIRYALDDVIIWLKAQQQ